MKKSLLLLFLLFLTLTASALELHDVTIDGVSYNLNPNTREARVNWRDGASGTNLVIPATIYCTEGEYTGTYKVTEIYHSFYLDDQLVSITIGSNVKSISYEAFYKCENLESVTFESGSCLTEIGKEAFYDCKKLKAIDIPSNVKTIGQGAFKQCEALNNVSLPYEISLIDEQVFSYCTSLGYIYLPSNVKTIKVNAFSHCTTLSSMYIDDVQTLEGGAFYACTGLKSITIPASVTRMTGNPFSGCTSLATVTINSGNSSFKLVDDVVYTTDMKQLVFCLTSKSGDYSIPSGVTEISSSAFNSCSKLTAITIPATVSKIGYTAFYLCAGLTEMTVPEGVSIIDSGTFGGCTKMATLRLPSTIKNIYSQAFAGIGTGLKTLYLDATTVPQTSLDAFYGTTVSDATLMVPQSAVEEYRLANPWREFGTINGAYPPSTQTFKAKNADGIEILYKIIDHDRYHVQIGDGTNAAISTSTAGVLNLPGLADGYIVDGIGANAFKNCSQLTEVIIDGWIGSIGSGAFSGCTGLTAVTNSSVEAYDIPDDAFPTSVYNNATLYVTDGLVSVFRAAKGWKNFSTIMAAVVINSGMQTIKVNSKEGIEVTYTINHSQKTLTVGNTAASKDTDKWAVASSATGVLTIPSAIAGYKVTEVGSYAFFSSNIEEVRLPHTVTKLQDDAFQSAKKLSRLYLSKNLQSIGEDALADMYKDCMVVLPMVTPLTLSEYNYIRGFESDNYTLCVPSASLSSYKNATGWKNWKNFDVIYLAPTTTFTKKTAENVEMTFKITDYDNYLVQIGDGTNAAISTSTSGTITIPEQLWPYKITTIAANAFKGCTSLTKVVNMSEDVYDIADNAFAQQTYNNATLQVLVGKEAEYAAAQGWKNFKKVESTITAGTANITTKTAEGVEVYYTVSDYAGKKLTVGGKKVSYSKVAAVDSEAEGTLTIPSSIAGFTVTAIDENAFKGCAKLTAVHLPATIASVGKNAFYGCKAIKTIKVSSANSVYRSDVNDKALIEKATDKLIYLAGDAQVPAGVKIIGNYAIDGKYYAGGMIIPEGVTTMLDNALRFPREMSTLVLPSTLTKLGESSSGCVVMSSFLQRIIVKATTPVEAPEKADAFYSSVKSATLYVPKGSKAAYTASETWGSFANIVEYDPADADITPEAQIMKIDNQMTMVGYTGGAESGNVSAKVVKIAAKAFAYNSRVKTVNFMGENQVQIESGAFSDCYALVAFTFPHTLSSYYRTTLSSQSKKMKSRFKPSATWTTFWTPVAMEVPEGVEAYVPGRVVGSDAKVEMKRVETINASQGVVLYAETPNEEVVGELTYDTYYGTNLLETVESAKTVSATSDGKTHFLLATDASGNPVFKKAAGTTLQAYTAFLSVPSSSLSSGVSVLPVVTDSGVLGIDAVEQNGGQTGIDRDAPVYNLSGQRVYNPTRGLYIVNGRKVVIK